MQPTYWPLSAIEALGMSLPVQVHISLQQFLYFYDEILDASYATFGFCKK
jgi:hypothetical protein